MSRRGHKPAHQKKEVLIQIQGGNVLIYLDGVPMHHKPKKATRDGIAARLISERLDLGLSQKDFAKVLGISPPRLCDYENGKVIPTTKTIQSMEERVEGLKKKQA